METVVSRSIDFASLSPVADVYDALTQIYLPRFVAEIFAISLFCQSYFPSPEPSRRAKRQGRMH